ncbi:MAG: hypothetical protein ACK5XN_04320, partial [Bacteroidota bacterium]
TSTCRQHTHTQASLELFHLVSTDRELSPQGGGARLLRAASRRTLRSGRCERAGREAKARRPPSPRLNSYMPTYHSKDEPPTPCRSRDISV